jgi:hypothetical protein
VKYHMLYLVKFNENEVKYIDLRIKIWNKENVKFNEKWNNIAVLIFF